MAEHISVSGRLEPIQVIKSTFRLYRKYFRAVLLCGGILVAFSYLEKTFYPQASFIWMPFSIFLYTSLQVVFLLYVNTHETGQKKTFAQVVRGAQPYILPATVLSAALFIITMIGIFLLIIPGIIWVLMFSLALNALVLGGKGLKDSLAASRTLTKGNRLQILQAEWGMHFPFFVAVGLVYLIFFGSETQTYSSLNAVLMLFIGMLSPLLLYEVYRTLRKMHAIEK